MLIKPSKPEPEGLAGEIKTRVLIVDDHPVSRAGVRYALGKKPEFEICAEAAGMEQFSTLAIEPPPRLVILDLVLGGRDGSAAIAAVREKFPCAAILAFSMNPEELFAETAIKAGADGYMMKTDGLDELLRAIETVLSGEIYLSRKMTARLLAASTGKDSDPVHELSTLTRREMEVFQRLGEGKTAKNIADELLISVKTVFAHRENLKVRLGISTGAELTRRAVAWVLERGKLP